MGQFGLMGAYSYAGSFGHGPDNVVATANRPAWTLCAFDGPTMAASFCTIPFTMRALGKAMPLGGVSAIGTAPEYRRRGLLRELMTRALDEMRERGQPVAALWASQAAIYQRYQYAMTTVRRHYTIDTVDIRFNEDPGPATTVAREHLEDAFDDVKAVYRQFVDRRIGYLHRSGALWQSNVFGDNDGPVHLAVARDSSATPLGYVAYTLRQGNTHPSRGQVIVIRDLVWLTVDTWRDLWRFIAAHDLVGKVEWRTAPLDDPTPEFLQEPRLLNTRDNEGFWFRIVDVPGALAGRGYVENGEVNIGIMDDPLTPWNNGTWHLCVTDGDAEVNLSKEPADMTMSVKTLASLFTGFRRAHTLAGWGLIEADARAVSQAERIFSTPYGPHCPDSF